MNTQRTKQRLRKKNNKNILHSETKVNLIAEKVINIAMMTSISQMTARMNFFESILMFFEEIQKIAILFSPEVSVCEI